MIRPQWMVLRDQVLGARPEEDLEAKADAALMADAVEVEAPDSAEAIGSYPVNNGAALVRVPVPDVKLKAIAPPAHEDPDFSPVGGHIDALPAEADPVDWSAKIQGARGDADRVRLAAGIGRAGETINAALGGRKADGAAYNSLDAHAKTIEDRPELDIKLDEMSRKYRDARAARDPNHPVNQRARAATPKAFAAMLGDAFHTMTAADLVKQFPVLKEAFKAQADNRKQDWAERKGSAEMENDVQVKQAQLAGSADQRNTNAFMAERGPIGNPEQAVRYNNTGVKDLAKETAKFADYTQSLKDVEGVAPGLISRGIVPDSARPSPQDRALMALPGGVGTWLASPKAKAYKNLVGLAKAAYAKKVSGTAVSEGEEKRNAEFFATGWMSNPDDLGPVMHSLAKGLKSGLSTMQKGFEAQDSQGRSPFATYTGPKYTDDFFSSIQDGAAAAIPESAARKALKPTLDAAGKLGDKTLKSTIKMINKVTGEIAEVSPEDAIEAMKDGFQRVTQ